MGSMVLNRLLLMMMINCICEMVVQRKSVKLIGLLWEALFFANLRHAPRRTWTSAEPEFRYVRDRLQISLLLWSEFKWIINFYFPENHQKTSENLRFSDDFRRNKVNSLNNRSEVWIRFHRSVEWHCSSDNGSSDSHYTAVLQN